VAAVDIDAPLSDVEFARNRFWKATAGVRYEARVPCHVIQLKLVQNTFCDMPVGLNFRAVPVAEDGSRVVVESNLFANVPKAFELVDRQPIDDATVVKAFQDPNGNASDRDHPGERLSIRKADFTLDRDPSGKAFLRYPKDNPLRTAGPEMTPVGAGPAE
jgi:hypothetical protein